VDLEDVVGEVVDAGVEVTAVDLEVEVVEEVEEAFQEEEEEALRVVVAAGVVVEENEEEEAEEEADVEGLEAGLTSLLSLTDIQGFSLRKAKIICS